MPYGLNNPSSLGVLFFALFVAGVAFVAFRILLESSDENKDQD